MPVSTNLVRIVETPVRIQGEVPRRANHLKACPSTEQLCQKLPNKQKETAYDTSKLDSYKQDQKQDAAFRDSAHLRQSTDQDLDATARMPHGSPGSRETGPGTIGANTIGSWFPLLTKTIATSAIWRQGCPITTAAIVFCIADF